MPSKPQKRQLPTCTMTNRLAADLSAAGAAKGGPMVHGGLKKPY
jgi:hypothetical protein